MPGNVVLIGFSGTGKSSVGRALAMRLNRPFVDTDERLVARFGMPIGDVFRQHGEKAFRDAEAEEVGAACALEHAVIALGGGAIVRPASFAAARNGNKLVRLSAPLETVWRRLSESPGAEERPMLSGEDPRGRMQRLLAEREPLYARADVTVETEGRSVAQVVDAIIEALRLE